MQRTARWKIVVRARGATCVALHAPGTRLLWRPFPAMSNVEIAEDEASANMAIISNEVCMPVSYRNRSIKVRFGVRVLTGSLEKELAVLV